MNAGWHSPSGWGNACKHVCNTQIGYFHTESQFSVHVLLECADKWSQHLLLGFSFKTFPNWLIFFFWIYLGDITPGSVKRQDFTGQLLYDKTWYPSAVEIKIPFSGEKAPSSFCCQSLLLQWRDFSYSPCPAYTNVSLHIGQTICCSLLQKSFAPSPGVEMNNCTVVCSVTFSALPLAGDDLEQITRSESFPSIGHDQSGTFCLQQNFCPIWGRIRALVTCDHE